EEPEGRAQADEAEFFMDYRSADGSKAQMCGNGTRVFATWLRREGLIGDGESVVATRAGTRRVRFEGDEVVTHMGTWSLVRPSEAAERGVDSFVHVDEAEDVDDPYSALSLDLGNPHTVVALPPEVSLEGLDLTRAPVVRPVPPEGSNVEFVRVLGPGHLAMRVHERGVGETRSCGTGVCAAALAVGIWSDSVGSGAWRVDVPGGTLTVRALPDHQVELAGPAVLVADGQTDLLTGA
ncbi:diaminopimelate epimerase, partial [Janibacter melonis]|uniref:diaminopimelate epimerase n=1 Tax=Janibacter melonis TaxID=262209 RepID=UPI0020947485